MSCTISGKEREKREEGITPTALPRNLPQLMGQSQLLRLFLCASIWVTDQAIQIPRELKKK